MPIEIDLTDRRYCTHALEFVIWSYRGLQFPEFGEDGDYMTTYSLEVVKRAIELSNKELDRLSKITPDCIRNHGGLSTACPEFPKPICLHALMHKWGMALAKKWGLLERGVTGEEVFINYIFEPRTSSPGIQPYIQPLAGHSSSANQSVADFLAHIDNEEE
jgi:hypothetical protein